jgi:hypothetical protein
MAPNRTLLVVLAATFLCCAITCRAQQQTQVRNFIIKASALHLLERSYKVGFEYKTHSLKHSLTIYASGISLKERHEDFRILTGFGGELQYRYYPVNEIRPERALNVCNFIMAFVRASQHRETFKTNPPASKLLHESLYSAKDVGVAYGMQLTWKRFTAEAYLGPAVRFSNVDRGGIQADERTANSEQRDHLRRPALSHQGWFAKGAVEIGFLL